jgi:predicted nucleic acid-binding protein
MIAYLDSSVALRHVLSGEAAIRQAFALGRVVASELLEIECRRTIHRCRLEGELTDAGVVAALERLAAVLAGLSLMALSAKVKRRAMDAFPVSVKTLDALHLASALALAEASPGEAVLVFSHDAAMNRCAQALGLKAPLAY